MLQPPESCRDPESALCAADVARGVTRMLLRHDLIAMTEVPLDGGRRADLMAIDARGRIVIVEIKVSRADLLGDAKWTDYLGCCDHFYWAIPAGFDARPLDGESFLPGRTGVIVADRYDAAIIRVAPGLSSPIAMTRRLSAMRLASHFPPPRASARRWPLRAAPVAD